MTAKKFAKKLTKNNPKDIEIWYALAQLQALIGEFENAVRSYYQMWQGPSSVYVQAVQLAVEISIEFVCCRLNAAPAKAIL